MVERWFLVPRKEYVFDPGRGTLEDNVYYAPKYHVDVGGYTGQEYDIPEEWGLPVTGHHYVVKFTADSKTLDSIAANDDAYTMEQNEISKQDVVDFMNRVTGNDYTFVEWESKWGGD